MDALSAACGPSATQQRSSFACGNAQVQFLGEGPRLRIVQWLSASRPLAQMEAVSKITWAVGCLVCHRCHV